MAQKYPLAWHEECLKNSDANLERKLQELARLTADIERHRADGDKRRARIEAARKKGITELTP
jgi:hypothetical protein